MYVKLFQTILTSTIWRESAPLRVVWITLLVMADREGIVLSSLPGLAAVAGVSLEDCQTALEKLSGPDQYSGTQEYEGRRIEPIDRGWVILNYAYYRDLQDAEQRRAQVREAVARLRAKTTKKPAKVVIKSNQGKSSVSGGKPIQIQTQLQTTTTSSPTTWVGEAVAIWRAYRGEIPPGRLGKALKPVITSLGEPEALRRFRIFANGARAQYNPEYFALNHKDFTAPGPGDFDPSAYSVGTP